jgi:hypothetical protein
MTKKPHTQTGERAIRAIFETASRRLDESRRVDDPDRNLPRDGIRPGEWEGAPFDALPPKCPVHVIGRDVEGTVYCLTATNDLRRVERWDFPALVGLFAPQLNYLYWAWPGWSKPKVDKDTGEVKEPARVVRVERDQAMAALVNAAASRPLFDPGTQHRGRGGWKDRSGRFLWHSGAHLWSVDGPAGHTRLEHARPAEHEGFLYTRQPSTIEPWDAPVSAEESPARRILEDLRSWQWERPYLDPVLCLGWLGTAFYGAALDTRPVVFTTGGAGVGKTTLHELFKLVLSGAVISFADTTAAGIYQRVKQDSLMVMVDELEAKAGAARPQAIIDLARIAYSGGDMGRGGADHEGVNFQLRNSFMFSAIQPPPMTEADRSRMAVLNLERLDLTKGVGRKPTVAVETDGRMILRQLMDGWGEFQRLHAAYWDVLGAQAFSARGRDTYAPLLACAELLVGPDVLEEIGLPITEFSRLGEIIADATAPDRAESLDNWHACLNRLLDSTIDAWRDGAKPMVGQVMDNLMSGEIDHKYALERLALVNLGARKEGDPGRGPCIAVPKEGPALEKLFSDTRWHSGGWFTALKQAPKGVVLRDAGAKQRVKINGTTKYCLLVDMKAFGEWVEKEAGG